MARYTEGSRQLIDETVERWKARCLLADGSLVFDDREGIWTAANIGELYHRFNEDPLDDARDFNAKWDQQLDGASEDVRLLAAELLLVHFLFASSVTKAGKLNVIEWTLRGTGIVLPPDALAVRALGERIGHPGIGFNTRRDFQIGYLIDFVRRWKELPLVRQEELLGDPWILRDFADDTNEPVREMRHILLHLLRPDDFERISSGTHKREIESAFRTLLDGSAPADLDDRLLAIRQKLQEYMPSGNTGARAIDFYHPPLHGIWQSSGGGDGDGTSDLEALLWNKQIVFYGPPGTGKTFQARLLAETLIRRVALDRWGPRAFFEHQDDLDGDERSPGLIDRSVSWVQLHPGIGYEEFIRGLRIDGGETRYEPGLLPMFIQAMSELELEMPDGLDPLPGVLVLDEINRTDLSRMLGEAFTLLERDKRGEFITLPGANPGERPDLLMIPPDLYVIGTMNEIDQSVETIDFALRRRFLWRECPFERETVLLIIAARWETDVGRFAFADAATQLETFADRAQQLNDAISDSLELGRQYQVGHTYFADLVFFLGTWLRNRSSRPPSGTYLWTKAGKPQPPLTDLWVRSLKPLLEQYLAGSDVREDEMRRFADVYFTPPS